MYKLGAGDPLTRFCHSEFSHFAVLLDASDYAATPVLAVPYDDLFGVWCRFADTKFSTEVQAGKVTASSLECFTCVALAGISAEYVKYGYAEGGTGDIQQLDSLLKSLQFTQKKADSEVRCAHQPCCVLCSGCPSSVQRCLILRFATALLHGYDSIYVVRTHGLPLCCRWAVLNDVAILRRHSQAHAALAEKMASQATVGECIAVLEDKLAQSDDL